MTRPWLRRHWFVVSVSAVAIAAGAGGAGFATWQVHRASLRQVSWDQARLSGDVLRLDQHAAALAAGQLVADANGDLGAMAQGLQAEGSARTAERQPGCAEKISASRAIERASHQVFARWAGLRADMAKLRRELIGVQQNLTAVETDVTSIRSLGGQLIPEPSSSVSLGDKALADATHQARVLDQTGRWLDNHALHLARPAAACH